MPSSSYISDSESEAHDSDSSSETSSVASSESITSVEENRRQSLKKKYKTLKKKYEAIHYIWKKCKPNSKEKRKPRKDMMFAKLKLKKLASKIYGSFSESS